MVKENGKLAGILQINFNCQQACENKNLFLGITFSEVNHNSKFKMSDLEARKRTCAIWLSSRPNVSLQFTTYKCMKQIFLSLAIFRATAKGEILSLTHKPDRWSVSISYHTELLSRSNCWTCVIRIINWLPYDRNIAWMYIAVRMLKVIQLPVN